jgi:FHS family L-fucose permease-like MFS transporter
MQMAYSIPLLCFVVIVLYAVRCMRQGNTEQVSAGVVTAS